MLELIRRISLAVGIVASLWMFFLADLTPFVSMRVPKDKAQGKPGSSWSTSSDELRAGPLQVDGSGWQELLSRVKAVSSGGPVPESWRRRIPPFELTWDRGRDVYFRADEPLIAEIGGQLAPGVPKRISTWSNPALVLDVRLVRLDGSSFHLGSGLSDYGPPKSMVFPFRGVAWWPLAFGLGVYLVLPRHKRSPDELMYAPWRSYLGDLGWVMLFTVFFGLPLAIVGGSVQALTEYPIFPLVLWPLALLGSTMIWFIAWSASFRLRMSPDGFVMKALNESAVVRFSEITEVSRVVHVYPRWFIRLMWIASLFGKGTSGMRAAGHALLLESSSASGLEMTLDNGSKSYVWLTDALGSSSLNGSDELLIGLKKVGLEPGGEIRRLTAIFPPMMTAGRHGERSWLPAVIVLGIVLLPAAAVVVALLLCDPK